MDDDIFEYLLQFLPNCLLFLDISKCTHTKLSTVSCTFTTKQWGMHVMHGVLVGRPEGKRPLGRPRHRWEDNIKMDLQEVGGGCGGLDGYGQVAGTCEYGNELSGSIKCREFLD
jgi:hypothetical protein